jgi:hypothetical protein
MVAAKLFNDAGVVLAQVSVNPDSNGLPGGATAQKMLNGLVFYGLLACAAALVVGGATWWAGQRNGNFGAAMGGRTAVFAGLVGAIVVGAAPALVNFFFTAGSGVH